MESNSVDVVCYSVCLVDETNRELDMRSSRLPLDAKEDRPTREMRVLLSKFLPSELPCFEWLSYFHLLSSFLATSDSGPGPGRGLPALSHCSESLYMMFKPLWSSLWVRFCDSSNFNCCWCSRFLMRKIFGILYLIQFTIFSYSQQFECEFSLCCTSLNLLIENSRFSVYLFFFLSCL